MAPDETGALLTPYEKYTHHKSTTFSDLCN